MRGGNNVVSKWSKWICYLDDPCVILCVGNWPLRMFFKRSTQEAFSGLIHTALIYQSLTQDNAETHRKTVWSFPCAKTLQDDILSLLNEET